MARRIPLTRPRPPALSRLGRELAAIEDSGFYSNYGPVNARLECAFITQMFGSQGYCVTACNATIGLMIALRHVARRRRGSCNFAVMPSFTFAAMPHAALWAGLTPLLIDIDPQTWLPLAEAEERMLRQHGEQIAALFPYATFGNNLDLDRYDWLSRQYGVPVVVDAAGSLGSTTDDGRAFGAGFAHPVVFSMHVTKAFATGEGGLIYSADESIIAALRAMGNFGFGEPRSATMPGLNAKLSEVGALLALAKLYGFTSVVAHRATLGVAYRDLLPDFTFQHLNGRLHALQFMPVLLPAALAAQRAEIVAELGRQGIGTGTYFQPHIAEQPFFGETCMVDRLDATQDVAARILSLPISDDMDIEDVERVCAVLREICRRY
jgi:dTDP-4-amino-4,6-dideoxygalactose transaminase